MILATDNINISRSSIRNYRKDNISSVSMEAHLAFDKVYLTEYISERKGNKHGGDRI